MLKRKVGGIAKHSICSLQACMIEWSKNQNKCYEIYSTTDFKFKIIRKIACELEENDNRQYHFLGS